MRGEGLDPGQYTLMGQGALYGCVVTYSSGGQ